MARFIVFLSPLVVDLVCVVVMVTQAGNVRVIACILGWGSVSRLL